MKKMRRIVAVALAICGLLVTNALFAQQDQKPEANKQQEGQPQAITPTPAPEKSSIEKQARVNNIVGKRVVSHKGEDLGTVDDLVLNESGCLDYLILGHGGLLGIGDRLVPIPWKAVKTGSQADTVIVEIDKEQLKKAPSFESKKWPNFSDSEWWGRIKEFFGKKE
jgi:sporulation protein YlmC with PRC-barrel domain